MEAARHHEPPRVSWRLPPLRGWSHESINEVFARGSGARRAYGRGGTGATRLAVGSDRVDCRQDQLHGRDAAPLGTPGAAATAGSARGRRRPKRSASGMPERETRERRWLSEIPGVRVHPARGNTPETRSELHAACDWTPAAAAYPAGTRPAVPHAPGLRPPPASPRTGSPALRSWSRGRSCFLPR